MASKWNLPETTLGESGKGVVAGGKRKKGKAARPALRPDYVVPADESSDVWRGERAAVRDFYLQHVGESLDDKPDAQQALHDAGLLNPAVARAKGQKPGSKSEVFASAMDALDWTNRAAGRALPAVVKGATTVLAPQSLLLTTERGRGVLGRVSDVPVPFAGRAGVTVGDVVGGAAERTAALPGQYKQGVLKHNPELVAQMKREKAVNKRIGEPQDIVFSAIGKMPFLYGTAAPESTTDYFSAEKAQDWAKNVAAKPNEFIDASAPDKTVIAGASPVVASAISLSLDGISGPEVQSYLEQSKFDGLSPAEDANLKLRARKAGHDVSNWNQLSAGDKITTAYTSSNYWLVTLRNASRAVGAMGATPAGVKAIGDAAFGLLRGDTKEGRALIEGLIQPYQAAMDTSEKQGLAAGLSVAFRDNPVDFLLAVNTALRTVGRIGGIATRIVAPRIAASAAAAGRERVASAAANAAEAARVGREVSIPTARVTVREETPLLPGPFVPRAGSSPIEQFVSWEQRGRQMAVENAPKIEEALSVGRVTPEGVPYEITRRPGEDKLIVGYTSPNLTSLVSLKAKGGLAKRWRWYSDHLYQTMGKRYTRTQANIADGVAVEVERILTDALGKRPTDDVKARAAWDLSRPQVLFGGEDYTPAREAAFYRTRIAAIKSSKEYRIDPETPGLNAQIKLLEDSARELDLIDKVEISPEIRAQIREAAKPLGEENTILAAAAMSETVKDAKRADYIRLLVLDPRFEHAARVLKAEKNTGKVALVRSQKRVASLSRRMLKRVTPEGYGAKGARKSREAFDVLRRELVSELRRAEKAALVVGDQALADTYRAARSELVLARAASSERLSGVLSDLESVRSLEAPSGVIPESGRAAYEAAQALAEPLSAAEARAASALGELQTTRGKPFSGTPNQRDIGLAEQAVERARADVASLESFPSPDEAALGVARERLAQAESRIGSLREARSAVGEASGLRKRRESAGRAAARLVERGRVTLDGEQVRVALDTSERLAGVRVRRVSDYGFYKLERAAGEVLDEFIARVEANDQHAILHLVQKGNFEKIGDVSVFEAERLINTGPTGRIRAGRLKSSSGQLFFMGGEDFKSMWRNLMYDTSELQSAAGWRAKMQQLIDAVSIKVSVSQQILRAADRRARARLELDAGLSYDDLLNEEVSRALRGDSFEFALGDFKLLNTIAPKAKRPSERTRTGGIENQDTIADLMIREVNERTIDPNAPGDYYLVPRALYKGIQDSLKDEAFRFTPGSLGFKLDRAMRAWRSLTLNILPKTAFANITGSAILALQGGAGPRYWYMAWRALTGRVDPRTGRAYPVPPELLQRYYDQFTPELGRSGRLVDKPHPVQVGAAWVAWWMNGIRRLNGMSEDLGRLAVWYSKAYPEALRLDPESKALFASMRSLNDGAMDLLESMARNDPEWSAKNAAWIQQSQDFLGYLHRGGKWPARLRIAIPFWQWYVHMLKLSFITMPLKYPGRALFLQQLGEIGEEYQQTHGVMVPWGEDLIPLWQDQIMVKGQPQWVTHAIGSSTWYPQGTVASLADREGALNVAGYVRGSLNPQISNGFLILMSVGAVFGKTPAFEYSDYQGLKAAKNEYGNEIDSAGVDLVNYWANRFGQMLPLAPTVMSLAGRPADSTLWNLGDKKATGAEIPTRRTDVLSALGDPWGPNSLMFLLKALTGVQLQDTPGVGPVWRERIRKQAEYEARNMAREERNIAEKVAQIHSENSVGGEAPSAPARAGGTEQ